MVITKTPFRFSLFGGGTDYPEWYLKNGGFIVASTLDYHCYISLRQLPRFFVHKSKAVYSQIETVSSNLDFQHPSLRECLRYAKYEDGLEMHHDSDIPAKTGIGSSSAFTVGLLNAISVKQNKKICGKKLAAAAIEVEQNLIGEKVGVQDQIMASYGGFKKILIKNNGSFRVTPLSISQDYIRHLEKNILFGFTGNTRFSQTYAKMITTKIKQNERYDILKQMMDVAVDAALSMERECNLRQLGFYLDQNWQLKMALQTDPVMENFNLLYDEAKKLGAFGGKMMGAGGGGAFYLVAPSKTHAGIRDHLRNIKTWLPIRFSDHGSSVIFNNV